ncbi:MAG: ParA family protein [Planctomycetes bacterium]|nr:ParA family protein [Planctomycetota bacterium]
MRSIALANQKGGVGKTTTAIHLAHGLTLAGQRTVLFDLDPQGNATLAMQGMDDGGHDPTGAFAPLRPLGPDLWILPSPGAERVVPRTAQLDVRRLVQLAESLASEGVDWLVIDCPPRMDAWGWAGLQLSQEVLIPVPPEFFPMHGLSQMVATLREAAAEFPGRAGLMGYLVTMLDPRESVALEVLEDLRENLGDRLLSTLVYRDPRLVEAASHGETVFRYNVFSKGARAYGELVREVMYGR